ncbi:hypothetical protein BLA29_000152, partial [Euroglyphus maynei]
HQSSNLVNNSQQQQQQLSSPNSSRNNAFIFQPISPRNTPTIQENSTLDMNIFSNNNNGTKIMPVTSQHKHIQTGNVSNISAAQSQPSSEANSPFVSPRNTPVSLPRSRNNSGQSVYSSYGAASQRQTPASLQNFDSGVSSISSSPFISPQSTPIPTTCLQRINQNNNLRNVSSQAVRVRHSSGPGGPISNRTQLANLMNYNRSNSLSPMVISDNCFANTFDSIINDECLKSSSTNEFINHMPLQQQQHQLPLPNTVMMTNNNISKSYPATPICTDMNFKFSNNNNQLTNDNLVQINDDVDLLQSTLDDLLSNNDQDVIQSGQDLIVSSVQPGVGGDPLPTNGDGIDCSSKESNGIINGGNVGGGGVGDCSTGSVFNDDLLIDDTEQFQTLDAFHDCDNDFNNIDLVDQNVVVSAYGGGDNDFTV